MSAKGSHPFILPSHVSIPLIDEFDKRLETAPRITFEAHFTNPINASIVDNSGLRFFLVPARQFAGDLFTTGSMLRDGLPPGMASVKRFGVCRVPEKVGRINVFGYLRHAHLRGRQVYSLSARPMRTNVYRSLHNYSSPAALFDYNLQTAHLLPEPHLYTPNDIIVTQCNYDTSKDIKRVAWGLSTFAEMCLINFFYYPRVPNWHVCMGTMGNGDAIDILSKHANLTIIN